MAATCALMINPTTRRPAPPWARWTGAMDINPTMISWATRIAAVPRRHMRVGETAAGCAAIAGSRARVVAVAPPRSTDGAISNGQLPTATAAAPATGPAVALS
jgi:hypothetical protein